jgi:hypothetical protein
MIINNCNQSDLTKFAESVPASHDCVVIPVLFFFVKSGTEQVIIGHSRKTYTWKCKRNQHNGSCEITLSPVNMSEQVMFVCSIPGERRDTSASRSGNLYALLMSWQLEMIGPGTTNEIDGSFL